MKGEKPAAARLSWQPRSIEPGMPAYRALSRAIQADIDGGRLVAGERLPPQRDLARALGLAPGTVARAYVDAERTGLVVGHVGRGTYVADGAAAPPRQTGARIPTPPLASAGSIDFSVNVPLMIDAAATLNHAIRQLLDKADIGQLLQYQPHRGSLAHRVCGVGWLARAGVETTPESVLVTSGAQHGIFVAIAALTRPGDVVLVEQYTYPSIRSICRHLGLELVGAEMDARGMLPESVERICQTRKPKVIYCIPNNQNPTCASMDEERRAALVAIARTHDACIVEDDVYGPLHAAGTPLYMLDPNRTIHVSSLSKTLAPGLRAGFMAVPTALIDRCADVIRSTTWMAPPLLIEIAARWIEDGADQVLEERRRHTASLHAIAEQHLGACGYRGHPSALHGWLELPEGEDEVSFVSQAQRLGVLVSPGALFLASEGSSRAIRISFGAVADAVAVSEGCDRLRRLLEGEFAGAVPTF